MQLLYFLCFNFFAYCRKHDMIKNIFLDAAKLHMHDYHTCKKEEKKQNIPPLQDTVTRLQPLSVHKHSRRFIRMFEIR